MSSQIILISNKASEVEKAESFAFKNRCLFSVYTPEEWGSRSDEAFLFHDEDFSQETIPLPSGKRPVFSLEEIEAYVIEKTLTACQGSVSRAARLLRIGRATLYRKMERSGLPIERFREMEAEAEAAKGKLISIEEERKKRFAAAGKVSGKTGKNGKASGKKSRSGKAAGLKVSAKSPAAKKTPSGGVERFTNGSGAVRSAAMRSAAMRSATGRGGARLRKSRGKKKGAVSFSSARGKFLKKGGHSKKAGYSTKGRSLKKAA